MLALMLTGCGQPTERELLDRYDPYATRGSRPALDFAEVDLGQYFVTFPNLESGDTRVMSVHVIGVVPRRLHVQFQQTLARHRQALRSAIRETLQRFDAQRDTAAAASELKSQLAIVARRSLGTDALDQVVFRDFSVE
jgi:hypothetical protein